MHCDNFPDGPDNITISPNESVFQVGTKLVCKASGKPSPTIQWKSLVTENTDNEGGELIISKEMVGSEQRWQCTAAMRVNGRTKTATASIAFALTRKGSRT